MNGKNKCKILKDIRRQIAQDNDIEFVTSECKYKGDCTGTCPKCEAEVHYLEQELAKRQASGKPLAIVGIAAALVISASGCGMDAPTAVTTAGDIEPSATTSQTDPTPPAQNNDDPSDPTYDVTAGVPAPNDDWEQELTGDPVPDYNLSGFVIEP